MKKCVLSLLAAVVCVLLSVEGSTFLSSLLIYGVAVLVLFCIIALWREWKMDEDPVIRKFIETD